MKTLLGNQDSILKIEYRQIMIDSSYYYIIYLYLLIQVSAKTIKWQFYLIVGKGANK